MQLELFPGPDAELDELVPKLLNYPHLFFDVLAHVREHVVQIYHYRTHRTLFDIIQSADLCVLLVQNPAAV